MPSAWRTRLRGAVAAREVRDGHLFNLVVGVAQVCGHAAVVLRKTDQFDAALDLDAERGEAAG